MSNTLAMIIENTSFIAMFIICMLIAYASFKRYKSIPGADLVFLGFVLYGLYALLGFTVPGFNGSYFYDFGHIGRPSAASIAYFISFPLRLGLILVLVGLCRLGRNQKD